MITYRELIANAKKKIELVDLENRAIYEFLMDILNCDRTKLILMEEETVSEDVLDKVSEMLADYIFDYKPIEYILGYTYFCGNKSFFYVKLSRISVFIYSAPIIESIRYIWILLYFQYQISCPDGMYSSRFYENNVAFFWINCV